MKKTIILGLSGGIAVYKACEITSRLKKLNYDVRVIMTKNATEFITPLTLETLSNNKVVVDMFEKDREFEVEHISYAKMASAFLIAPATANFVGKIANGIADDMLTTTIMATTAPKIICPAMNTNMYHNPIFEQNLEKLRSLGYIILEPIEGLLACGDIGAGKMLEPIDIVNYVNALLRPKQDYFGKRVLITAGGTSEPIDGVRFITNRSSGKMGIALAERVIERGGNVTLVVGNISVETPKDAKVIKIKTTDEMYDACLANLEDSDIIIKAAAPSDYKVKNSTKNKIKAENITLELTKNIDIAKELGKLKGERKLIVFSAETEDLLKNATEKLANKNGDMIVANDVTKEGAGFEVDTNIATLIFKDGGIKPLKLMTKKELADIILDNINSL